MKKFRLSEAGARGWFIGDFPEAVVRTKDFEVCWQGNPAGARDRPHMHKIITEVQLITSGRMIINGEEFGPGDIYVSEPGEEYHAYYTEDTKVVAIKFPSIPTDKYYIPEMISPFDIKDCFQFEAAPHDFIDDKTFSLYLDNLKKQILNQIDPVIIFINGHPLHLTNSYLSILESFSSTISNPVLFCTGAIGNWNNHTYKNFIVSNRRYFEFEAKTIWERHNKNNVEIPASKTKKYLYASTKDYPTRKFLLANLINNNHLSDGYVGYSRMVVTDWANELQGNNNKINQIANSIDHMFPLPALDDHLDWVHMATEIRTNSYLNIVTDTFYHLEPDILFLSEKVFNAMTFKQMFMYLGPAGSLRYLRNEGYETFHEYIDESYDDIYDPYQRLLAFNNSMLDFISKPLHEIEAIYLECMPKLIKNKNKLFSSNFKEQLLGDLESAKVLKNK